MKTAFSAAIAAALLSTSVALPTAASAQRPEKILTIFGNDPCPVSNGEEIVVCRRLDEGERYRIPEELRETVVSRPETWGDRARSVEYVGRSGTDSCSASGAGGGTGCFRKLLNRARAEKRANGEAANIEF